MRTRLGRTVTVAAVLIVVTSIAGAGSALGAATAAESDFGGANPNAASAVEGGATEFASADGQSTGIDVSSPTAKIGTALGFSVAGSSDAESYEWSFGDGSSASGRQVTHAYLEPGTYTVTVSVVNESGDVDEYTTEVTVEPEFADVTEVEPGEKRQVTIDEPSAGDAITAYAFDAEEGQAVSVIASGGREKLRLYGPDKSIVNSWTVYFDRVLGGTTAERTGTYYVVLPPSEYTYTFSTDVRDPDPFEPNQEASSATAVEPNSGIEGTVTASDPEDWFAVEAGPGSLNATAGLTLSALNQNDIAVDIYDADGNRIGELGADVSETTANGEQMIYEAEQGASLTEAGTYYVRVRQESNDLGHGPSAYELTVNATERDRGPTAEIDASPSTGSIGSEIRFGATNATDAESYAWNFGDGRTATGRQATHAYTEPGTYTVTLTVEGENGDTAESTTEVTVEPEFAEPTPMESGETVEVPARESLDNRTVEVYEVTAESGQIVAVTATGPVDGDELLLYDPDGRIVDSMEMYVDSKLVGTTADRGGTYRVVVGQSPDPSTVTATVMDSDGFEPNQDRSNAEPVEPGSQTEGTVTASDTEDWFAVEAGPGPLEASVGLTLPAVNQNDVAVEIYDGEGRRVGDAEGDANRTHADGESMVYEAQQRTTVSESGTYYVRVRWLETESFRDGPSAYELTVDAADAPSETGTETRTETTTEAEGGIGTTTETETETASETASDSPSGPASDASSGPSSDDRSGSSSGPSGESADESSDSSSDSSNGDSSDSSSDSSSSAESADDSSSETVTSTPTPTSSDEGTTPTATTATPTTTPTPTETETETASESGQSLCADCNPPQDLDGDGTYEDVDGDGERGFGDAVTLFENLGSDAVTENSVRYDYNGNGEVGLGDVVQLVLSM